MKRIARLYADGSFNVDSGDAIDLADAKHRLGTSQDDDDTELVEVEIRVIKSYGKPKLSIVTELSMRCPCCQEIIEMPIDEKDRTE